jgi:hypothetical protein
MFNSGLISPRDSASAVLAESLGQYQELRVLWRLDPVLYARQRLGLNPTRQQQQLFEAIAPFGARVSVRAGHSTGKSTALAATLLWHLETHEFSRIPCTAPTASQLYTILWAELAKWMRRSDELSERNQLPRAFWLSSLFKVVQNRIFDLGAPNEWFAIARTARKESPDALQGFHATDLMITADDEAVQRSDAGGAIMYVVDEASGVDDAIIEVIEGALAGRRARLIMAGNPVRNTGFFARSHHQDRSFFTALHFRCDESPLPAADYREKLEKKYGIGSNVVRVRADGEFPKQDDDVLISLELAEAALMRDPITTDLSEGILGVDVARFGDDRTTLVLRKGRQVGLIEVYAKIDTMETVGRVVRVAERYNPSRILVDVDGLGGGVVDRLKELGMPVRGVHALETATLPPKVTGKSASRAPVTRYGKLEATPRAMKDYMWMAMADWFADDEPSLAGCDRDHAEDLVGECTTVCYSFDSSGRLVVESKDELKKRDLRSPDLAEGLALTFCPDRTTVWERLL